MLGIVLSALVVLSQKTMRYGKRVGGKRTNTHRPDGKSRGREEGGGRERARKPGTKELRDG